MGFDPLQRTARGPGNWRGFVHALAGIVFAARNEPNMRVHLVAAVAAVAGGAWLRLDVGEWRWLILAVTLVIAAEILNTAVEQTCNAVTIRYSSAIKAAKDAAAGAVLLCALAAALIGATIFLPHLTNPATVPACRGTH